MILTITLLLLFQIIFIYSLYLAYYLGRNSVKNTEEKEVLTPAVIVEKAKKKVNQHLSGDKPGVYLPSDEDQAKFEQEEEERRERELKEELNKIP